MASKRRGEKQIGVRERRREGWKKDGWQEAGGWGDRCGGAAKGKEKMDELEGLENVMLMAKDEKDGRVFTSVRILSSEDRISTEGSGSVYQCN